MSNVKPIPKTQGPFTTCEKTKNDLNFKENDIATILRNLGSTT